MITTATPALQRLRHGRHPLRHHRATLPSSIDAIHADLERAITVVLASGRDPWALHHLSATSPELGLDLPGLSTSGSTRPPRRRRHRN